jgi:AcrR family transcriptional regulator
MAVLHQRAMLPGEEQRGPRARTRRLMLDAATRLMQAGITPSVSEVAEAAAVSRATAYRYFPTQAALVHAVIDEALGPILTWNSTSTDPAVRLKSLIDRSFPRIEAFEATFKAALRMALEQWALRQAGSLGTEAEFTRGHRKALLARAVEPLKSRLPPEDLERLTQALSLLYGVEALTVLKDIWGLDGSATRKVVEWAVGALLAAAVLEAAERESAGAPIRTGGTSGL